MKNKKTLMFISALMILIFHLWINITPLKLETYLRSLCVIGVDIFFFISAYSIGKKDKINYKEFITNRFLNIYLKFIILTVIYGIYKRIDIALFIRTILGIELFTDGGGSFLWFVPAIMIMYILLPLYKKIDSKKFTLPITSIIYLGLVIMISSLTDIKAIFIFLNRVPIILLGYYFAKYNILEKINKRCKHLITGIILIFGIALTYTLFIHKIYVSWFYDIYYIINIPLIIGAILLFDNIKPGKIIDVVGNSTLEIYGLQMIFGFELANKVYIITGNSILTNISVIVIIVIISVMLSYCFKKIKGCISK